MRCPTTEGRGLHGERCGRPAYRKSAGAALAVGLLLSLSACVSTPITGRQAFNLFPIEDDRALGQEAYGAFLADAPVDDSSSHAPMVQRVVDRLVPAAQELIPVEFDWEVHVIRADDTANAWCMPGGKMAVYTGILPLTQTETGLAVVMGHEIGHAIARHGTERMSQQVPTELLLAFIDGEYSELAGSAAQMLVFLPWGRKQELEADHIGLILMARAGYDPREAVDFWSRMAAAGGPGPAEILSTHPSDETRIERIRELLPEALAEYQAASGKP